MTTQPLRWLPLALTLLTAAACADRSQPAEPQQIGGDGPRATATFAGGCFWCMEPPYDELDGVLATISGYTNGETPDPTYKQVSAGVTGHTEAVQVTYDPSKISYEELVEVFWRNIDPTVANRQFCDRGSQYRSGIYYHDDEQKRIAEASLTPVKERFGTVYTEIEPAATFYPAEEYHQDYYRKNPIRYKFYRNGCGRDDRLKALWSDPEPQT